MAGMRLECVYVCIYIYIFWYIYFSDMYTRTHFLHTCICMSVMVNDGVVVVLGVVLYVV